MSPHLTTLVALTIFCSSPALAEIEKFAIPCEDRMCFHWWPALPEVKGWIHDREASLSYSVNAQIPIGSTFANAHAVIYAKASYKPRMPQTKSLLDLIAQEQKHFLDTTPDLEITETPPLTTQDGQTLRSFMFAPRSAGQWERVSYGEEDDFYLSFVVSAKSKEALDQAMEAYLQFISRYQKTIEREDKVNVPTH